MYLLLRACSEYTENDIMLGVFRTKELAEAAKAKYIADVENNDPHREQGYMDVCLQEDVKACRLKAKSFELEDIGANLVYILHEEFDCLGQIWRNILKASTSLEEILAIARSKQTGSYEFPTSSFIYNALVVDRLYYENEDNYVGSSYDVTCKST